MVTPVGQLLGEWNDVDAFEALVKKHRDQVSALIMTPFHHPVFADCELPADGFFESLEAICQKEGILLILDDIRVGVRLGSSGSHEYFGIRPDMACHSKAIGNGYPISVVAGREDIMRKVGDGVVHGGTYTCHSVSLAAAEKTLEILDETDALETIANYGSAMQAGMSKVLNARGIEHSFSGHPAMGGLFFNKEVPGTFRDWLNSDYTFYDAMAEELHELGILCEPDSREPWFICESHAKDDSLEVTLSAFETAVDMTLEKLKRKAASA